MERDEIILKVHGTFGERKRLIDERTGPVKKKQDRSQCYGLKPPDSFVSV